MISSSAPKALPIVARETALDVVEPLFRSEVLAEQQSRWLGTVLLTPKIGNWAFTSVAVLAAAAVLSLLIFGSYARKARVEGWLVPAQGMIRVFAPQTGVVTSVLVSEGAPVEQGAQLLTVSTERQSRSVGATGGEVVRSLRERRDSMIAETTVRERLIYEQALDLTQQIATMKREAENLEAELALQQQRIALSGRTFDRLRRLRDRQLATETAVERAEQDSLDQRAKLQSLKRAAGALQREQSKIEGTLQQISYRRQTETGEIARGIAALEQQIAEAESRREVVLQAPQAGTVTAVQVAAGASADPTAPLLSIVPAGSKLKAHLFGTSRAVGFVRPGQRVLLRYQAFAYQKFGSYEGAVESVSRSALSPAELGRELEGLTGLLSANEPVYRITVDLGSQSARAYGQPVALQAGMRLNADIVIERRRLIEWVLDPLFALTGQWHT